MVSPHNRPATIAQTRPLPARKPAHYSPGSPPTTRPEARPLPAYHLPGVKLARRGWGLYDLATSCRPSGRTPRAVQYARLPVGIP